MVSFSRKGSFFLVGLLLALGSVVASSPSSRHHPEQRRQKKGARGCGRSLSGAMAAQFPKPRGGRRLMENSNKETPSPTPAPTPQKMGMDKNTPSPTAASETEQVDETPSPGPDETNEPTPVGTEMEETVEPTAEDTPFDATLGPTSEDTPNDSTLEPTDSSSEETVVDDTPSPAPDETDEPTPLPEMDEPTSEPVNEPDTESPPSTAQKSPEPAPILTADVLYPSPVPSEIPPVSTSLVPSAATPTRTPSSLALADFTVVVTSPDAPVDLGRSRFLLNTDALEETLEGYLKDGMLFENVNKVDLKAVESDSSTSNDDGTTSASIRYTGETTFDGDAPTVGDLEAEQAFLLVDVEALQNAVNSNTQLAEVTVESVSLWDRDPSRAIGEPREGDGDDGPPTGALAGIIVGISAVVILGAALLVLRRKRLFHREQQETWWEAVAAGEASSPNGSATSPPHDLAEQTSSVQDADTVKDSDILSLDPGVSMTGSWSLPPRVTDSLMTDGSCSAPPQVADS